VKSGLLAALAFFIFHAAVPQSDKGTIEGSAQRTDTKAPIAGVQITVTTTPANGTPLFTAVTGSDGHFAIADVPQLVTFAQL